MSDVDLVPDDAIQVMPPIETSEGSLRPGSEEGLVIDSSVERVIKVTLANDRVPDGPYVVSVSMGPGSNVKDVVVKGQKAGDTDLTVLHEGQVTDDKVSFPAVQVSVISITLLTPVEEGTDYTLHLSIHACYNVTGELFWVCVFGGRVDCCTP